MKLLSYWISLFAIILTVSYIGIKIDIYFHPWLSTAAEQWKWWNYFISEHCWSVFYLLHFKVWISLQVIFSGIGALYFTAE